MTTAPMQDIKYLIVRTTPNQDDVKYAFLVPSKDLNQGRFTLGKNGDMDQHNSVRAPTWWGEGSANIFPSLWLNKNWYKLDEFKEYTL